MTTATQEQFLTKTTGWHDVDKFAGAQCKDLADLYCLALFGDWINTIRPGNGNMVFANANPTFFEKVRNNPADPNQLPPRGAICSWAGTRAVPEGHVNIYLGGGQRPQFLEQNGYTQKGVERNTYSGYELPGGMQLIGWLIPKLAADKPRQCIVERGDSMWSIAVQFGVSIQGLVNANPQVKDPNVLRIGQVLTLP